MQEIGQSRTGVHGVGHKYRCGIRIRGHLHILHLVSVGVKETVAEDYSPPVLQVGQ
jgi:hypothetical protein